MQKYTVVLVPDPDDGAFTVTVPALPGIGRSRRVASGGLALAREAIVFHLECLAEEGEPLPDDDRIIVEQIEVEVA